MPCTLWQLLSYFLVYFPHAGHHRLIVDVLKSHHRSTAIAASFVMWVAFVFKMNISFLMPPVQHSLPTWHNCLGLLLVFTSFHYLSCTLQDQRMPNIEAVA